MNKPQMIIFDYGHTLLYEPDFNFLHGEKEIYKHIVKNPRQLTAEKINTFAAEVYQKASLCREYGLELNNLQTMKLNMNILESN